VFNDIEDNVRGNLDMVFGWKVICDLLSKVSGFSRFIDPWIQTWFKRLFINKVGGDSVLATKVD
jgi:hypothetical protein